MVKIDECHKLRMHPWTAKDSAQTQEEMRMSELELQD